MARKLKTMFVRKHNFIIEALSYGLCHFYMVLNWLCLWKMWIKRLRLDMYNSLVKNSELFQLYFVLFSLLF